MVNAMKSFQTLKYLIDILNSNLRYTVMCSHMITCRIAKKYRKINIYTLTYVYKTVCFFVYFLISWH